METTRKVWPTNGISSSGTSQIPSSRRGQSPSLPTWLARQNLARLAAQQAARTGVIAASPEQGAAAAGTVVADAGLDPATDLRVSWDPGSSFARGGLVTARVTVESPAVSIPFLGGVGSFPLTATYSERVDQYRSGP